MRDESTPKSKCLTQAFAHRGYHDHAVENSLAAIQAAYAAGCDGVEFDVQLSSDGIPVLFHDDDLQRLAGRKEAIYALTWTQLREIKLNQNGAQCTIPTLEDFLSRWGDKPFYLELKVPASRCDDGIYLEALVQACLRLLSTAHLHAHTFLASFHLGLMRNMLAQAMPWSRLVAGLGARLGAIYEDEAALNAALQDARMGSGLSVHSLEYALYIRRCERGLALPPAERIWVWGLHGELALQRAYADGLGGIVADDVPAMLRLKSEAKI